MGNNGLLGECQVAIVDLGIDGRKPLETDRLLHRRKRRRFLLNRSR